MCFPGCAAGKRRDKHGSLTGMQGNIGIYQAGNAPEQVYPSNLMDPFVFPTVGGF